MSGFHLLPPIATHVSNSSRVYPDLEIRSNSRTFTGANGRYLPKPGLSIAAQLHMRENALQGILTEIRFRRSFCSARETLDALWRSYAKT